MTKDLQRPNDATRDRIGWLSIASDERHEHRATHQGAAVFVNSLSEEPDLVDQTAFGGRLEWVIAHEIAHEIAHLFVVNDDDHFDGSGIVLSKTREDGLSKFVEDEIVNTRLRQRASINRDANGNPQP